MPRNAQTASSKKAKGSRLEREVATAYRHYGIDDKATRMPMSGAMAHFKGDIWKPNDYEYLDECKNSERVKLWEWWDQAKEQTKGTRIPVLHISRNNSPVLTVIALDTYMNMRKEIKDLREALNKK